MAQEINFLALLYPMIIVAGGKLLTRKKVLTASCLLCCYRDNGSVMILNKVNNDHYLGGNEPSISTKTSETIVQQTTQLSPFPIKNIVHTS